MQYIYTALLLLRTPRCRYNPRKAKDIIAEVHRAKLSGKVYHPDNAAVWTREISDEVKHQLKALGLERYKIVVQVVLGEQKGEGVKCAPCPGSKKGLP